MCKSITSKNDTKRHKWTKEEEAYLISIAYGRRRKEIAKLLNRKFKTNITVEQLRNKMRTLGVKTNLGESLIGSERVLPSGYIQIRTGSNTWEFKHKIIYEKHFGKLEDNDRVLFLDGDKTNFNIDNLKRVSKAQLVVMNRHRLIYNNAEATKMGIALADLIMKRNEVERKIKK